MELRPVVHAGSTTTQRQTHGQRIKRHDEAGERHRLTLAPVIGGLKGPPFFAWPPDAIRRAFA